MGFEIRLDLGFGDRIRVGLRKKRVGVCVNVPCSSLSFLAVFSRNMNFLTPAFSKISFKNIIPAVCTLQKVKRTRSKKDKPKECGFKYNSDQS